MWFFPNMLWNRVGKEKEKVPAVSLVDRVIASAKSIVGQKEKPGNSGFLDPKFSERMNAAGWNKGESWCIYTVEDIWDNAMGADHPLLPITDKLFSGSATATFANFSHSDKFKTGKVPKLGAIAIWQYGKTWKGHGGVVIELLNGNDFKTVEGNTNAAGGREGIEVAIKKRRIGDAFKANALNLKGFIYLPEE